MIIYNQEECTYYLGSKSDIIALYKAIRRSKQTRLFSIFC